MRNLFSVIILGSLVFASCTNRTVNQPGATGCDKLKMAADSFEKRQAARWENVKSYLTGHPEVADSLFKIMNVTADKRPGILSMPMDSAFAYWFIENFRKYQQPEQTSSGETIPVTENVWVDREAILTFANTIVEGGNDIDGIRIYYAKYPSKVLCSIDPNLDPEEVHDRQHLIMVATKKVGDEHHDYFEAKGSSSKGLYIYDYNSLCPSICKGARLGAH